ncbi:hypothetical protein [Sphingomonas sp.]|uniref:hypothetical protein n=1 Tax=Sphingomonas sp. TaxID=28214 RepID=UPI003CC65475
MRRTILLTGAAAAGIAAFMLAGGGAQTVTPPKVRYYMDVSTASGPLAGGLRAMMRGGGESRSLTLRLGSTLPASDGAPHADHFLPAGAQMGASVPLISPTPTAAATSEPTTPGDSEPGQYRRPQGRLLIFWGCGAHAGPGQPVIIDFAHLGEGQLPPNLFTANVPVDHPPSAATSRTFGQYPIGRVAKPRNTSSLIGDHRVAGNYSPAMAFNVQQDFLPALNVTSAAQPDGSSLLSWNSVTNATGYYAWAFGSGQNGDAIWWASSSTREMGGGLWDYVAPSVVARLAARGTVMPAARTSCAIPAEAKGSGQLITFMTAFGPELNFAYPPRPANPRVPWHPDWEAKVRYKSTTMVVPGMGGAAGGQNNGQQPCRPSVGGIMGGMLGRRRGC